MSTARERRHQRTQNAIIEAARQIIRESGVDALSIRAIADQIDYSPAGLYEYFGSKEEIIQTVCQQGFERFAQHLGRVDKTLAPDQYIIELGAAYIDFAVKNSDFFLLMFTTAPLDPEYISQKKSESPTPDIKQDNAFAILLAGVQRCIDAGVFHERPGFGALEIAYGIWSHVHGLAMLRITIGQQLPLDHGVVERHVLNVGTLGMAAYR